MFSVARSNYFKIRNKILVVITRQENKIASLLFSLIPTPYHQRNYSWIPTELQKNKNETRVLYLHLTACNESKSVLNPNYFCANATSFCFFLTCSWFEYAWWEKRLLCVMSITLSSLVYLKLFCMTYNWPLI